MHLIDADPLADAFADADPRLPYLVFALYRTWREEGPFAFDAADISRRLAARGKIRQSPEEIVALQPALEPFFEAAPEGWRPRGPLAGAG